MRLRNGARLAIAASVCLLAACPSSPPPQSPTTSSRPPPAPTSTPVPPPAAPSDAEAAEDAVLAKLVRDETSLAKTVFVCVRDADLPPDRLARLASVSAARIRGCRAWVEDPTRAGTPLDPESHEPGVVVTLTKTERVSESEFQVTAGYFCGNLCSAIFRYGVRRKAGGWVVVSQKTIAVS